MPYLRENSDKSISKGGASGALKEEWSTETVCCGEGGGLLLAGTENKVRNIAYLASLLLSI